MSSDDVFAYFGLNRETAHAADVKRAYAKRLKETRPDDDPEGFMHLRQTMEAALNQIKWREEQRAYAANREYDGDESNLQEEFENDPDPFGPPPEGDAPSDTPTEPSGDDIEDLQPLEPVTRHAQAFKPASNEANDRAWVTRSIEDIRTLMDTPSSCQNWEEWLAILDREDLEGIDAFQLLSYRLRNLVCQETAPKHGEKKARLTDRLSPEILLNLDERFGWSHQTGRDYVTRHENLWISQLVDTAKIATGRTTPTHWEKVSQEMKTISRTGTGSAAAQKIMKLHRPAWVAARIILIIALINLIYLLFRA
ncbi:hypothetical protein [Ponticaulis sp.]|uniref:hypothetical protein n=1 Tax=Ponticaulis sp. TaxID=2020902 RepID=UPI000B6C1553|nr:hypothetical protein [Ponticaulis sp.]MAI89897.1 hypothetical protein [Ponticaulis sp.]OUX99569.1 MAG: hypothetical protein CBB65_05605 [Hyphomonadaceae bacterium TMED5]|tara:strand:+ start:117257 stop:118186 length:930 start_codon:yes stop_codon:yes gene_type:complete